MPHRPDTWTDALIIYPLYHVNFSTSFMEWFRFFFQWRDSENREYLELLKNMKSSASESVENGCFNLERLSRSSRLAQPGISALERLSFRSRTFHEANLMLK